MSGQDRYDAIKKALRDPDLSDAEALAEIRRIVAAGDPPDRNKARAIDEECRE